MIVEEEGREWTLDSWLVQGSSMVQTKVGTGRGVPMVGWSRGRQKMV